MMGYADRRADLARGGRDRPRHRRPRRAGRGRPLPCRRPAKADLPKIAGLRIAHDAGGGAGGEHPGHPVVGDDERLTAFFAEEPLPEPALRARLAALADCRCRGCRPYRGDLPRLAQAKARLCRDARARRRPAAPDGALEACFSDLFHPRPVTPRDSFASLSGDSLPRHLSAGARAGAP